MSDSEDENDNTVDCDVCSVEELGSAFKTAYTLASEEALSLKKIYILHLDHSSGFERIATANSDNSIIIYDLQNNNGVIQLSNLRSDTISKSVEEQEISGIKFSNTDASLLFAGTASGKFIAHDLRTPNKSVFEFECDPTIKKPITCFDISSNDSILCAGTEHGTGEAYLLYFDIRQKKSLGAYTDSHEDDVTQIKFHPTQHNLLASGSTDGLINVFDINQTDEDDALVYCLNTESSVQTISWHKKPNDIFEERNTISCITHTNDFHLYDVEESETILAQNRSEITALMKRKSADDCYLINCHATLNDELFLLVGSNYNSGECLRSLTLDKDCKNFMPRTNFIDNKQIVRCSVFNAKDDVLITAGEGGIITVWQSKLEIKGLSAAKLKETTKLKDRKVKPY